MFRICALRGKSFFEKNIPTVDGPGKKPIEIHKTGYSENWKDARELKE
jgi:hypothetical protein